MLFLFVSSILNRFLIIPAVKDKTVVKKVKLALAIPIGVPTTYSRKNNQSFIYVIKGRNIFTYFFTAWFSLINFLVKILFNLTIFNIIPSFFFESQKAKAN